MLGKKKSKCSGEKKSERYGEKVKKWHKNCQIRV